MSKKNVKIVVIGGGSGYIPELIEGLTKISSEVPVKEVWLVDIPQGQKKPEIVGTLAQRMSAHNGGKNKNLL